MDDRDARVVFDAPAHPAGRATEGHFFIIEEEILVHPTQLFEQSHIHQHARAGDPIDRARSQTPFGLVFPSSPWYQLLPSGPEQAGKGADRWLTRPVGVAKAEADD